MLICAFYLFIYFGVLRRFQHWTGHITTGSWKGRGNQYIEFVRVLYCKLPTNGKQLPAFPLEAVTGIEPRFFFQIICVMIIVVLIVYLCVLPENNFFQIRVRVTLS